MDRVNGQLDKVDQITDSAVDAADSVDTAVRAVSFAVTRPVQKVSGFAAGVSFGVADFKVQPRLAPRRAGGEGGRGAARERSRRRAAGRGRRDHRRDPARHSRARRTSGRSLTSSPVASRTRLDVTYDDLDDLQVGDRGAARPPRRRGELVVSLSAERRRAACRGRAVRAGGARTSSTRRDGGLDLQRVLETVCDTHEVEERDGGAWVELTKRTARGRG